MTHSPSSNSAPTVAIADNDPVMRLAHYALAGEGEITTQWVEDYFAPETCYPDAIRGLGPRLGYPEGTRVVAGTAGSAEELLTLVPEAELLLLRRGEVTAQVIAAAPKLKAIQKLGAQPSGIDTEAARRAGIEIGCVPRRTLAYTAEHALLLMLAVSKRLIEADAIVRGGNFDADRVRATDDVAYNWPGLSGLGGLYGKTLGIVGLGEVGSLVTARAAAFGMTVLYTKRQRLPEAEEARLGIAYRGFSDLLGESDVVSIHVQATPETRHMFGAEAFAAIKSGAILVNTSRGSLIDETALLEALSKGKLGGAGLDNHRKEPRPPQDKLCEFPNVVMTPHIAGGSRLGVLGEVETLLRQGVEGLRKAE